MTDTDTSTPERQPLVQPPHHRHAIAAALAEEFPDLRKHPHYLDELASIAATAVEASGASRCIRWIRPHQWNHWRLIQIPMPHPFTFIKGDRQQRECTRCGRIERSVLVPS